MLKLVHHTIRALSTNTASFAECCRGLFNLNLDTIVCLLILTDFKKMIKFLHYTLLQYIFWIGQNNNIEVLS